MPSTATKPVGVTVSPGVMSRLLKEYRISKGVKRTEIQKFTGLSLYRVDNPRTEDVQNIMDAIDAYARK